MTRKNQFDAMADYFRSMLTPAGTVKPSSDGSEIQSQQHSSQKDERVETRPVLEKEPSELSRVARLIEQVTPEVETQTLTKTETQVLNEPETATAVAEETEVKTDTVVAETVKTETDTQSRSKESVLPDDGVWHNIDVPDEFQALFFVVHGVTFAVPLINLGNIANMDKITSIFGKPDWFMGMMNFRDDKYNVVDFVRWAMPNVVEYEKDFTYVIQMENSKWAITCSELIGTENLHKSQIQWRSTAGKRPWLSGLVKDKMCALIHVNELIKLFNQGINIEGDKS